MCEDDYEHLHLDVLERIGKNDASQRGSRWSRKAISDSCKNILTEPTPYNDYDDDDDKSGFVLLCPTAHTRIWQEGSGKSI